MGVHNYNSHSDRTGEEGGEVIVIQKEGRGFFGFKEGKDGRERVLYSRWKERGREGVFLFRKLVHGSKFPKCQGKII